MKTRITTTERLLGGAPFNKQVYTDYIRQSSPDIKDELDSLPVPDKIDKVMTGFHRDDKGIFLYDYHIRGFLKEAGNNLKGNIGIKNLKSKIDNFLFVFPRKIYLAKMKPDGILERPLRAMTMQGPRVSLAMSEYLEPPVSFEVEFKILDTKIIPEDIITQLLDYGQYKGLLQWRNASYGRFSYEMIK